MLHIAFIPNRGILRLRGADKASFLQGLVTNDVNKLSPTQTIHTLLLTPQGKFLYDLIITQVDEEWWIEADKERLKDLHKRLSLYKLKSNIELDVDEDKSIFTVWGTQAYQNFKLDQTEGCTKTSTVCTAYTDPRLQQLGVRLIVDNGNSNKILDSKDIILFDADDYRYHRLQLGVPESSAELPIDKAIPLECGMDELNAIDWGKGCYMGQELTARTRYRGLVRKRLLPCRVMGEVDVFSPIYQDNKEVGEWRSLHRDIGLALLRLEALGNPLTSNGIEVQPLIPDWVRLPSIDRES